MKDKAGRTLSGGGFGGMLGGIIAIVGVFLFSKGDLFALVIFGPIYGFRGSLIGLVIGMIVAYISTRMQTKAAMSVDSIPQPPQSLEAITAKLSSLE